MQRVEVLCYVCIVADFVDVDFERRTVRDVGDDEMSRLPMSNEEAPVFTFRSFVSTDLSYSARGPVTYDLQTLTQSKGAFTADVGVPRLNERQTGILMTPEEIPLLRGILAG